MNKKKKIDHFLIKSLLFLFLFYYSYRYALKMNSSGTSPTYSDTPLYVQLGKYLIFFFLILFIILNNFYKRIKFKFDKFTFVLIFTFLYSIYSFLITKNTNVLFYGLIILPIIIIKIFDLKINFLKIDSLVNIFIWFTIFYEFIQIFLYFKSGRLPALAYATGKITDVRFGGPWDDPNGFAIMLCFMIPYSFLYYNGKKKYLISTTLFLFLILTWSLTGYCAFLFSILYFVFKKLTQKRGLKKQYLYTLILVFSFILVGISVLLKSGRLSYYLNSKMASIFIHLEAFNLTNLTIGTFLGIHPVYISVESGYIDILYSFGILGIICFIYISIYSLKRLRYLIYITKNPLYIAMEAYMVAFMFATINLPMQYLFSNYGIYVLCICASLYNGNKYNN